MKIEQSRKIVSGYSEREIWILTEGLNGGVVTYPSLAGFTHTLHTLLLNSLPVNCTLYESFTCTLHTLVLLYLHTTLFKLCVHFIFYSHFFYTALFHNTHSTLLEFTIKVCSDLLKLLLNDLSSVAKQFSSQKYQSSSADHIQLDLNNEKN